MLPELSLVQLFLYKDKYDSYRKSVELTDFPKELQPIVRCIDNHFLLEENPQDLVLVDLANVFFATRPKDRALYEGIFDTLGAQQVASEESCLALIHSFRKAKLLRELSVASYEVSEGKLEEDKLTEILGRLSEFKQTTTSVDTSLQDFEFISTDLEYLVENTFKAEGLRWRLKTLNKMMGSLRKGDFGFLFARPETGKTTFLASECTYMAQQAKERNLGPVLWCNNEEQGDKVMLRCYQAALGLPLEKLFSDLKGHKQAFNDLLGDNFKLYDNANISKSQVEKLVDKLKPSLVIFDQIDKIKGFDNDREDLRLGAIYQWAREIAKNYCPTIGVCQADGTGEGQRWLTMAHVANAKTAKQAEADWILGIGKVNDVGYDSIRYLHLSKNKLLGDSDTEQSQRHGRMEVLIEAEVARYKDLM